MTATSAAYDLASWNTFAAAEVGAAAALTGLLFVAVSINLERILSFPKLPARAGETLVTLVLVLVAATLTLIPQSTRLLGLEVAILAGVTAATTLTVQIRHGPDSLADPAYWYVSRIASVQTVTLSFLLGGCSLAAHWGGGLYWFAVATVLGFLGAVYNAWVLLVEIVRPHRVGTSAGSVPLPSAGTDPPHQLP